jgi:16S rRNA U516 pseudouridylate synthase RsuA-like enzyme
VGSGLKTGRRIFYLKVEEGKRRSLKNLFDFFGFAVSKILHVSTVTIVYEH